MNRDNFYFLHHFYLLIMQCLGLPITRMNKIYVVQCRFLTDALQTVKELPLQLKSLEFLSISWAKYWNVINSSSASFKLLVLFSFKLNAAWLNDSLMWNWHLFAFLRISTNLLEYSLHRRICVCLYLCTYMFIILNLRAFPGGAVVKNPPANAGDTRVQALVREDPTCCRATKRVCHNYWNLHT